MADSYMSQTSNLILRDPVCCIPLSVAIKDATFGLERSFLPEYVWVPDKFPYICSSCRSRRRVEDSGGRSWWEDPSLTTCSTSVIKHVLSNPPHFTQAVPKQMVSAAESSEWHNSWILNKRLIYTVHIWFQAQICFDQPEWKRHKRG